MTRGGFRRSVGLRTQLLGVVGVYCLVILVAAGLLFWVAAVLDRAVEVLVRDTTSMAIASEANLELLAYQRLSHLALITEEPQVSEHRERILRRLRALLERAADHAADDAEAELIAAAAARVEAYVAERLALEAQGVPADEVVLRARPLLSEALATLYSLRERNAAEVEQAQASSHRTGRVVAGVAFVATAAALLGLLAVVLGLGRWLVRPVRDLEEVIHRYRRGEWEAEARPTGPRELREIAAAFNEMREDLARQRENQLAFVAGVAHDVRTPLAAMKLGVQRLRRTAAGTGRVEEERLQALDRQFARLDRLVGDLMDAARIEAGRLDLRPVRFDLREAARDVVALYRPVSLRHRLELSEAEEPVPVLADRARIEQVVGNLVSNAIKYSPDGGKVIVRVRAAAGEAEVEVCDEGVGIPPEEVADLFRPFHRRDATRHVGPGAGLGLAIVQHLARAHGGRIAVESQPDRGSLFRLLLPLERPGS